MTRGFVIVFSRFTVLFTPHLNRVWGHRFYCCGTDNISKKVPSFANNILQLRRTTEMVSLLIGLCTRCHISHTQFAFRHFFPILHWSATFYFITNFFLQNLCEFHEVRLSNFLNLWRARSCIISFMKKPSEHLVASIQWFFFAKFLVSAWFEMSRKHRNQYWTFRKWDMSFNNAFTSTGLFILLTVQSICSFSLISEWDQVALFSSTRKGSQPPLISTINAINGQKATY